MNALIMEHYYSGRTMEDVLMEAMEVVAVFIAGQEDDIREKMVSKVETYFREMVFGGAADEIRTLIMYEDGVSH